MKKIKLTLFYFVILLSNLLAAQNKTVSIKEKDTIGEIKISPIVQPLPIQPPKIIICSPSRATRFQYVYVLDEKIIDEERFLKINHNNIESVKILRGGEAKLIYGDQAINGAIILTSKNLK